MRRTNLKVMRVLRSGRHVTEAEQLSPPALHSFKVRRAQDNAMRRIDILARS